MEYGSIQREIHVEASPEIVYAVITEPQHISEWWNGAQTDVVATPGFTGEIAWGRGTDDPHVEQLTVVDADPPRLFSFRWVAEGAPVPSATNSLLVAFELTRTQTGTLVRITESGFREKGWDAAVLEQAYIDHVNGWNTFSRTLAEYIGSLAATS